MTISADLNTGFKEWLQGTNTNIGVDFGILVLTAGSWPVNSTQPLEFQCPEEVRFLFHTRYTWTGMKLFEASA